MPQLFFLSAELHPQPFLYDADNFPKTIFIKNTIHIKFIITIKVKSVNCVWGERKSFVKYNYIIWSIVIFKIEFVRDKIILE